MTHFLTTKDFKPFTISLLSELNKFPLSLILITDPTIKVQREQFDKVLFLGFPNDQSFNQKTDLLIFSNKPTLPDQNYISINPQEVGKSLANYTTKIGPTGSFTNN